PRMMTSLFDAICRPGGHQTVILAALTLMIAYKWRAYLPIIALWSVVVLLTLYVLGPFGYASQFLLTALLAYKLRSCLLPIALWTVTLLVSVYVLGPSHIGPQFAQGPGNEVTGMGLLAIAMVAFNGLYRKA